MPKKSKTIRLYDDKSLRREKIAQQVSCICSVLPEPRLCGTATAGWLLLWSLLRKLLRRDRSAALLVLLLASQHRQHRLTHFYSLSGLKIALLEPVLECKSRLCLPVRKSAKSLSSLQKVIHRETEKLPKERNELIDSSSYRLNDFPSKDSGSESGMTLIREEIAQGVDSCETVPVSLRDDMKSLLTPWGEVGASRRVRVKESLPCERGGRSPLLDSETTQSIKSQPKLDRLRWRDLEEQSPLEFPPLARGAKIAFTLAEVLITLAIIGVVAALTIPSLIENHNEKAWLTAKDLWQKKLVEATRQMNIDGVMTGVAQTTEDYMDIFKKYVKVIKTCDNSKLKNCYSPKIVQTAGDEVEVSGLKTSNSLGQKWNTNTMGFVIADGTTVIMAYNPNCDSVDPFSKEGQNGQVGCMSMMIDVNGKKGPNKVGKDILLNNATISKCDIELGNLCLAGSDGPITSINTCDGSEDFEYDDRGSTNEFCATNYWAASKKHCEELGMRLPTPQELADITTYIYKQENLPIRPTETRNDGLVADGARASELAWEIRSSGWWSSVLYGQSDAYIRVFYETGTMYGYVDTNLGNLFRCVSSSE